MKRVVILALIGFSAWNYYANNVIAMPSSPSSSVVAGGPGSKTDEPSPQAKFTCDGRAHCSQMNSRTEAVFFINHCPNTKMDGDRDGIPCENDSRF